LIEAEKEDEDMIRFMRSLLVLGGLLAATPSVFAEGKRANPAPVPFSPGWQACPDMAVIGNPRIYPDPRTRFAQGNPTDQAKDAKVDFVGELISILNETRSPDAFLVTLSILQEIKPDARAVVPVIIRNAERLRLFKRTDPDQPTEPQKMIVECIAALLNKVADSETGALIGAAMGGGPGALAGAAVSTPVARTLQQVETRPGTAPEVARPAQDPLLGTPGAETKPATGAVIPGKVKSRPGIVK
jgi:hypothetical protein